MPKEVKQNRNTMAEADASAGLINGKTTVRNRRIGEAPSTAAASSTVGSIRLQTPPTVRTTTAML